MKKLVTCILISILWIAAFAQSSVQRVMEKRAREMHRVMGLTDKEQWRKFIKENYTQALIDKPMRAVVEEGDKGSTSTSQTTSADNLEAKTMMFKRLHDDFGGARISSIKSTGDILKMVLDNGSGLSGTFQLQFSKYKPYLINGLGIEVGN